MTFETVIPELFERFPDFRSTYNVEFDYMGDEPPLAYMVFGSILVPALEKALDKSDLHQASSICSFLEDVAMSARESPHLADLLRVEIGEWMGSSTNEELLAAALGPQTKRICRYVPSLANQRLQLMMETKWFTLKNFIVSFFKRYSA